MKSITSQMTTLHNGTVIPSLGYRVDKDNKDEIYENVLCRLIRTVKN